jgi:hypothetical protein
MRGRQAGGDGRFLVDEMKEMVKQALTLAGISDMTTESVTKVLKNNSSLSTALNAKCSTIYEKSASACKTTPTKRIRGRGIATANTNLLLLLLQ